MVEIKEYSTEKDFLRGGEYIIPKRKFYNHSKVNIPFIQDIGIKNEELY
jgi:hypothetical protein